LRDAIDDGNTKVFINKINLFKAKYRISIADSIAIAETIINKGSLITADHHEIGPVEMAEKINVTWFR
jgi:hypothetical protein